jgi:hypothetical protein
MTGEGPGALPGLRPELVSTSIWGDGPSPVIFTVRDAAGVPLDASAAVRVRVVAPDGSVPPGSDEVPAAAVRLPDDVVTSFIAEVVIPAPGDWRLEIRSGTDTTTLPLHAQDRGGTPRIGGAAPGRATPTIADVGGTVQALTTVRDPDPRLYEISTVEATAAGTPYVLLIDSARFETTPACGRALSIMRFLVDRWPDVRFIHLEPYEYQLVDGEPVLLGSLEQPRPTVHAQAWGLGAPPWPPTAQPWMFVVDGGGTVRATYTGIMGSDDIEIVLGLVTGRGLGG